MDDRAQPEGGATSKPLAARVRRGLQILVTPSLLREQIEYWRHGPAQPVEGEKAIDDRPWPAIPPTAWSVVRDRRVQCNLCGWEGPEFPENLHAEYGHCQQCGASARERFFFHCLVSCVDDPGERRLRLLETSPRLGAGYREAMSSWFDYVASDFDESAHRASIRIDLQDMDLPDGSLDVVATAHVLEHVPDPDRAMDELFRVLVPGGHLLLQVPLQQGVTGEPTEPEFHQDDTPVFWRFGWDLAPRLEKHGFEVRTLCTQELADVVGRGEQHWPTPASGEFDTDSILAASAGVDLTPVVADGEARRFGLQPAYMLVAWHARKPA